MPKPTTGQGLDLKIKGYHDGYDQGYASTQDRMLGEDDGTRDGITAAQNYAQTVLKPQFFEEFFNDALNENVSKDIQQDKINTAQAQQVISQSEAKELTELLSQVSPVTMGEVQESLEIDTNLNSSIQNFKVNLTQAESQSREFANATSIYVAPSNIPYENVDCTDVYADLNVFKSACESAYTSAFSTKYLSEHKINFASQYTGLYEVVVQKTETSLIEAAYESGLEKFYPIALESGLSDGKKQIYHEAYNIAKNQAYNLELPNAEMVAESQASNEVREWIAENAAVKLKGAEITNSDLRGGSVATLSLDLKNISQKDLLKPIRVVITGTQNAVFENKVILVKNVPGNQTTTIDDIKFKISNTAKGGDQIKVTAKVLVPGGKYNNEKEESLEVKATAVVNPTLVENEPNYISNPKVKGIFRYNTLFFTVNLAPAVEDIKKGYTVTLTPLTETANLIKMKTATSFSTGSLAYNKTKSLTFKYSFVKAAKGKIVKLELKYIFDGKVKKTEIIELRPR